jgi:hypothetical protein
MGFGTTAHAGQGSSQWGPTKITPEVLAKKTDDRLHTIENASVAYVYQFQLAAGQGAIGGMAEIKNQTTYRIQAPVVGYTEKEGPYWEARIADGSKLITYPKSEKGKSKSGPLNPTIQFPASFLVAWLHGNVKFLFDAVGTKANPLEALVQSVRANPSYSVIAQERTIRVHGIPVTQYRIYIEHDKRKSKTLGELYYEVDIDGKYFIPITMNNLTKKDGKKYSSSMMNTAWNLHFRKFPAHCFDPKTVHLDSRDVYKAG